MSRALRCLLVAAIASFTFPLAAAGAAADLVAVSIDSEPDDLLAHGRADIFVPTTSTITAGASGNPTWGISVQAQRPVQGAGWSRTVWVDLMAPLGGAFAPGTWETSGSWATASAPGLSVAVDGAGCSQLPGVLTIHEISLTSVEPPAVPVLTSLALSFRVRCEAGDARMFGEVRYHSDLDLMAPIQRPETIGFEKRLLGTTSAAEVVSVTNEGTLTSVLGQATIIGAAADEFVLQGDSCSSASLEPSAACTISVAFAPDALGTRAATLRVPDDTARGAREVTLLGTGTLRQPRLTLDVASRLVVARDEVRIEAHLAGEGPGRVVTIFAKPLGLRERVVAQGSVGPDGMFVARVTLTRKTSLHAEFAGDGRYLPDETRNRTVSVRALVTARLSGSYATQVMTHLYHRGRPVEVTTTVFPNKAGRKAFVEVWMHQAGRWVHLGTEGFGLSERSAIHVHVIGLPVGRYRLRAYYPGDLWNERGQSAFVLARVTA